MSDQRPKSASRAVKKKSKLPGIIAGVVGFCVLAYLASVLTSSLSKKTKIKTKKDHQITLITPAPPPPPTPKLEQPEVQQEREVQINDAPQEDSQEQAPVDDNLGVDAEGGAGGDSFGLVGKKGGASLVGGSGSPLAKYRWYNQIVEQEIKKHVDDMLKKRGYPREMQAVVDVYLNEDGDVVRAVLHASSGHSGVDEIIVKALDKARISQRPPEGMPRGMRITIASRG